MKRFFLLTTVILLAGCGNVTYDSCAGVDTTRPPDSITTNNNQATYTWGPCVKVFVIAAPSK